MTTRAKDVYTADGTTQEFPVSFPFISRTHISVTVAGVEADFSFNNDSQISIASPTINAGDMVVIKRNTSHATRLVDYVDGSNLTEGDLDLDSKQAFYMAQEAIDERDSHLALDLSGADSWDGLSKKITDVATPTGANDVSNKAYVDAQINTSTTNADNASASATAAATSASNASTSEANALTYKTAAETAKTASETAQTASETAKTASETAQTAAETALDTFDDRMLGAKSANPTLDNDGNALIDGAMFFDTTNNYMKVYDLGTTTWYQLTNTTSDQNNINTVAGISSAVSTVSGISSAVSSVNSNSANINTVSGSISNVNNCGNSIANINTVSSNLSSVDNFAEKYRIASSAPTSSLDTGDLYFDTTADELKVYKSSGWAAAGSTINGTSARFTYNISGTPSSVTGADANGNTLAYDAGFADVYLNGVRLSASDITITSGTSVVFASALANGDVVDIVGYGTFNVAAVNASVINAGTLSTDRLPTIPVAKGGTNLTALGNADEVLKVNSAGNALEYGTASSPEVYGFNVDATGNLIVTTTNKGADNISEATYATFDDVVYASSNMSWSLSGTNLRCTI
jgi:hypothetical protein